MLKVLNWQSTTQSIDEARLILMYKIIQSLVAMPTDHLTTSDLWTRSNHEYTYEHIPTSTSAYTNSFLSRTILHWNKTSCEQSDLGQFQAQAVWLAASQRTSLRDVIPNCRVCQLANQNQSNSVTENHAPSPVTLTKACKYHVWVCVWEGDGAISQGGLEDNWDHQRKWSRRNIILCKLSLQLSRSILSMIMFNRMDTKDGNKQ